MGIRNWIYFFKNAIISTLAHRLVHAISVGTIAVSLLLFGLFILLYVNLGNWVMTWGQSRSMSVYIEDGVDKKGIKRIESILKNIPGAEIKGFISKEKAMMDLVEALGEQSGLLEGMTKNPLPASFEIIFEKAEKNLIVQKKMKEDLEKIEGIHEVQYSEQWQERFKGLLSMLKIGGFTIGGLLCLAVLFIITNTIKLTIYARRNEIEIYKIVGATDWFIKIPFLIEGAIQGIAGGFIALLILFLLYSFFTLKKIYIFGLPVLHMVFLPGEYTVFLLSLSMVLGLVGGFIAVGRFFNL